MPFIGNKPSAVPLTSADITDDIIVNADINTNAAITTEKLSLISTASVASVTAKGTPSVSDGYIQLNCEQNSHGIKIKSPPHSAGANYTLVMPSATGTSEQVLRMNTGATALEFASAGAAAGQVIQVLSATDSTERTTTSTSYVTASNTMSVSITPSSASNKVLILISSSVGNTSAYDVYSTVYRGATNLGGANGFIFSSGTGASSNINSNSFNYLDSPSTTSSTTYQFYFKTNSGTAYINRAGATGVITVLEIKG